MHKAFQAAAPCTQKMHEHHAPTLATHTNTQINEQHSLAIAMLIQSRAGMGFAFASGHRLASNVEKNGYKNRGDSPQILISHRSGTLKTHKIAILIKNFQLTWRQEARNALTHSNARTEIHSRMHTNYMPTTLTQTHTHSHWNALDLKHIIKSDTLENHRT